MQQPCCKEHGWAFDAYLHPKPKKAHRKYGAREPPPLLVWGSGTAPPPCMGLGNRPLLVWGSGTAPPGKGLGTAPAPGSPYLWTPGGAATRLAAAGRRPPHWPGAPTQAGGPHTRWSHQLTGAGSPPRRAWPSGWPAARRPDRRTRSHCTRTCGRRTGSRSRRRSARRSLRRGTGAVGVGSGEPCAEALGGLREAGLGAGACPGPECRGRRPTTVSCCPPPARPSPGRVAHVPPWDHRLPAPDEGAWHPPPALLVPAKLV